MQNKINQISKAENPTIPNSKTNEISKIFETNSDKTNEIRNYKRLLDDGIITEEEFQAKKKQLLGL